MRSESASPTAQPVVPPVVAAPVGGRTARGAFWTIGFSFLNKGVALASQIVLAWFLLPEDMGLVGMAVSVSSVGALLSGMNLKNVLVQRAERFDQDAGQVFWLSILMGGIGAILLAAASPLCGVAFHNQRVVPLILLLAGVQVFGSVPVVYAAALSRELRFRRIAAIQFVAGLINNLGAVALAAKGFGPYSLVLPLLVSAAFAMLALRLAAGRIVIPLPSPSAWPALLAPAGWLMLYALLAAVLGYGANFVIGVQHDAKVAGFYFWGFSLASQAVFLLASNLQGIIFPALTKLNQEPERQYQAFQKTLVVLLAVTVPVCVLQILLAEPAIKLVFHDRWLPAAGVVQGLSIGLVTQSVGILSTALLMARGAFRTLCLITGFSAALTLAATALGGFLGTQAAVALAVGLTTLFANLLSGYVALRLLGRGWRQLAACLAIPLALGLAMAALGFGLRHFAGALGPLGQTLLVTLVTLPFFAVGALLLLPEVSLLLQYRQKPGSRRPG